jgi:hypothetical protein
MAAYDDSADYGGRDFRAAFLVGQGLAGDRAAASLPSIKAAAQAGSDKLGAGGRLVYVGSGWSGLIAIQDGAALSRVRESVANDA